MTETERQAVAALAIMDRMLDVGCWRADEYTTECFYCQGNWREGHTDGCVYMEACALRDREPEQA